MRSEKIKIVFFGTPEFASVILENLIKAGYKIPAVFTQPDKKIGRKREIIFSPVKQIAQKHGIKIFQPESLRDIGVIGEIREIRGGLFIVAAYGKILPRDILEIPRFGCVNVHASLLPKYRGASPVQNAILSGERETGVTLMLMDEKMDEGDILAQKKTEIGADETAEDLLEKLGELGAETLVEFLPAWTRGAVKPEPQDGAKATYCRPISREDGRIDWTKSAEEIFRRWRAFYPWPGAHAVFFRNGRPRRLKLTKISLDENSANGKDPGKVIKYDQKISVQTGKGAVILEKIQLEGKKEMGADEFARGYPEFAGTVLK